MYLFMMEMHGSCLVSSKEGEGLSCLSCWSWLKFQLEEVQRLPAIHGVGDPSKGDGNRQIMMHPSKFNYVEPQPSLQMDQYAFFLLPFLL